MQNGPSAWRRERQRYAILQWVYRCTGARCETSVLGRQIQDALGIDPVELYRLVHYLEHRGYLTYQGAGPRICISPKGVEYIDLLARRRRSIRE